MKINPLFSKILSYIVKGGLFILPITAFIVSATMFFPFITGKNFFFRIMVEIIFALWLVLVLLDKKYRPQVSPLLYAVVATIIVLILSTIFGENPYRSFWSNYERMEGLVGHLHLFAYFLVLISALKKEVDWKRFLYVLTGSGAVMAIYGWLQYLGITSISAQSGSRLDGTFGNATYMAIFMVFQAFLVVYLFFKVEKPWLKYLLTAFFVFELPIIFLTATRGAILGFLGGIFLLAVLLVIFNEKKNIKVASLSIIGSLILLVAVFWIFKESFFVKQNPVLSRFSNISFKERTVESRFTIWKMSAQGFKEHPILGWGMENYNLVFNKYYNPILWRQEPWFDRSHNVVFDWLISGGLLGFLAYLSIFGSAFYILWRKFRQHLMSTVVLTGLLAAYFFHNLFVFDNLISYYLFFSVLGFIHYKYQKSGDEGRELNLSENNTLGTGKMVLMTAIFIGLVSSLYFVNVKPIRASRALLNTLVDINITGRNVDLIISDFNKVFSYNTFGTGEAREQLSGYTNNIIRSDVPEVDKAKALSISIEEMKKQISIAPDDARSYIFLSALQSGANQNAEALVTLTKALELSPQKQHIFFLLADINLAMGNNTVAQQTMQTAYDLDQDNTRAAQGLAITAIVNNQQDYADQLLEEHYGTVIVADQKLVNVYVLVGNFERVKDTWLKFIENEPNNVQYHVNLAATYLQLGERILAIKELEIAVGLNPEFKEQGEYFISEIKAGRNP